VKGATEFLDQVQNNPEFIKRALACASDAERKAFLRQEGFEFDPDEFEAALSS
jgi:predicted ribosomally synthesized peptide with nif11-like leader